MRAAVLRGFGRPLEVEDVDVPVPEPDEVLVRVRAAGICATDVKLVDGKTPPPPLPHIPGHEIAGDVVEDGADLVAGQRVACHIVGSCGSCEECARGYPVLCAEAVRLGLDRAGGMAEFVAVPRAQAIPIEDSVSYEHAAVGMDAVTSPWYALHVTGRVAAGEKVVIVGVGGLGASAVQLAVAAGAAVAAVDVDPGRLVEAGRLGAELAVEPAELDALRAWAKGGADMALELSGRREGFDLAAAVVRGGGRVVVCGYAPGVEYGLDSVRLVLENIRVLGSRNLTPEASRAALAAIASGDVTPAIARRIDLAEVNQALEQLRAGRAGGRVVIVP